MWTLGHGDSAGQLARFTDANDGFTDHVTVEKPRQGLGRLGRGKGQSRRSFPPSGAAAFRGASLALGFPSVSPPATSSFRLHVSNQFESLADALAEEMRARPGDALAPERIVVPHPVLGRWLALELAERLGIAAHLTIELPAEFAWSLMRSVVELPKEQPFAPGALRWRVFDVLAGWGADDDPRARAAETTQQRHSEARGRREVGAGARTRAPARDLAALARYLADADPRKRFALADRLARVYDRCLLYRPEWIRAWQRGEAPHWQAQVWRELVASGVGRHWVDAVDAFELGMRAERSAAPVQRELFDSPPRDLKATNTISYEGKLKGNLTQATTKAGAARVSFFGVDSLSPSYLSVLRMAARDHDIHLFQLSPCREFWADTRSRRELRPGTEPAPYVSEGNELLAAWGRAARDMQALLADDLGLGAPDETYSEPATTSRLAFVQQDVLDLRLSTEATESGVPRDDSIQIHVCHSATREAEVLHDRLLGLFDAHDDIQPADVLVLTPNMDEYAPAIEAVFDSIGTIPFNIGRLRRRDGAAVRAFLDLLALPGSRYPVSSVMAPLRASSVASRFDIRGPDLPEIRGWIANAGIHWGIGEHDVPSSKRHTWQHGLNRLLLGYALAGSADRFGDFASCDLDRFGNDGPDRYERLGHFARYAELAFGLNAMAEETLTPTAWAQRLREAVLKPFFATEHLMPEVAREADTVARLIEDLEEEWHIAGIDGAIAFSVVREALYELGAASSRAVARLADGVTVAPLGAGQVFPAKVVCTVGMNDGAFPRHHAPASFDIVAADSRRPGDRDLRDEDRLAFLTALLSARKAFLVTYTGRELREDSNIPPSVAVSELVDYLARRFADDKVALRHPLQPFNRKYFDAAEEPITGSHSSEVHFSYSAPMALAAAAVRHQAAATVAEQRLHGTLPPLERTEGEVELTELIRFAAHPAKHFAQTRLGLRLEIEEEDPAKDEEPLELNYLEQWQLKDGLFDLLREELGEEDTEWLVRARGLLPPGNLGAVEHRRGAVQVATLRQALAPHAEHLDAPRTLIDIGVGDMRLTGEVAGYVPAQQRFLWWRIGRIREKDRIEVWLRLLALTSAIDEPLAAHVVGVRRGAEAETLKGPEPKLAREMLGDWVQAWHRGAREPLPVFPQTSWTWATEQNEAKVRSVWSGGNWPENNDEYFQLLCAEGPDMEGFADLAESLLGPIVEAMQ